MLQSWFVISVALAYIGFLFAVASFGGRLRPAEAAGRPRPYIYSLSLAVYCTSWTFFGSVGLATTQGFDFLTIYLGPILVIGAATPVLLRIVEIAKAQNITSIADFLAARYGKHQGIAALVTVVAIVGSIPYISLQLKAVSSSLLAMMGHLGSGPLPGSIGADLAAFVAFAMAAFAVLFGTRHTDATEHQEGLMLAVATESIVKLVAFLTVGFFVTFLLFDGLGPLLQAASEMGATGPFSRGISLENWFTMTLLSAGAFILLPRQFHVAVVENRGAEGNPAGAVDVSALPRPHQPFRGAGGAGGHGAVPAPDRGPRRVRAGGAAGGGSGGAGAAGLRRRAFRRHGHGHRGDRGAGHHGLQ